MRPVQLHPQLPPSELSWKRFWVLGRDQLLQALELPMFLTPRQAGHLLLRGSLNGPETDLDFPKTTPAPMKHLLHTCWHRPPLGVFEVQV